MSQQPMGPASATLPSNVGGGQLARPSASSSEESASTMAPLTKHLLSATPSPSPGTRPAQPPGPKPQSCVTCRSRKVKCDKSSPCSNCRRANIPCVFPSRDKPPRWARRLERIANDAKGTQDAADPGVTQVMDRLRSLEGLVKELNVQLEQARAVSNTSAANSPSGQPTGLLNPDHEPEHQSASSPAASNTSDTHKRFGRLVLEDGSRSHYVSSGFWSRVNDELHGLKADTEGLPDGDYDSSDDESHLIQTPSTQELDRTPSERHAFLFQHNLSPPVPDMRRLHPLPSQAPFLLNIFSENINSMAQVVHMPTVDVILRATRSGDRTALSPANEALLFSIYYAAITSLEEEDVMTNFGTSKAELNMKYRLGLEHALAKANFLTVPDIILVQAFAIFLFLVRRHDSPRYVWMMSGLVIRMAQALGLHRDGSHFPHLTPYQVEIRRRVWWAVCMLDLRSSDDQDANLTISHGSFDTRLPLNINESDLNSDTIDMPHERQGVSDMTLPLVWFSQVDILRQMVAPNIGENAPTMDKHKASLRELFDELERRYLRFSESEGNIAYWVAVTVVRLVVAKMTLIVHLPQLFLSPTGEFCHDLNGKLFIAALEVAEYNHMLNAEQTCRQWRWIFQTYTHWHAIIFLLVETSRRSWSPLAERAWVALHSCWLIPARAGTDKNLPIWMPLRKLMARAKKHRLTEIGRLRCDAHAAQLVEMQDEQLPRPASTGTIPGVDNVLFFRDAWRKLVSMPSGAAVATGTGSNEWYSSSSQEFGITWNPQHVVGIPVVADEAAGLISSQNSKIRPSIEHNLASDSFGTVPNIPTDNSHMLGWNDLRSADPNLSATFWEDANLSASVFADMEMEGMNLAMDIDHDVDWNDWLSSAKNLE